MAAALVLVVLSGCGDADQDQPPDRAHDSLIEPGRFGPLKVGMTIGAALETGLAEGPAADPLCGDVFTAAADLADEGLVVWFDHESPYELRVAGVQSPPDPASAPYPVHTAGGLTIGSPASDVVQEFGDQAVFAAIPYAGGEIGAYVVFDGKGGALMIQVDAAQESEATTVSSLLATAGRSIDNYNGYEGGC
jgi:hypothetical protein